MDGWPLASIGGLFRVVQLVFVTRRIKRRISKVFSFGIPELEDLVLMTYRPASELAVPIMSLQVQFGMARPDMASLRPIGLKMCTNTLAGPASSLIP